MRTEMLLEVIEILDEQLWEEELQKKFKKRTKQEKEESLRDENELFNWLLEFGHEYFEIQK